MPIIQTIRENRLVPVKSYRVSGSDGKNCRQPRNFQNLVMVSANSRLPDGRLQKLRGGGTRFSEKVKSYLTARFDVDTQRGRKPDLSEVARDMRTTRNTGSSRTFQRRMAYKETSSIILFQTVCNQQENKGWPKSRTLKFVTTEICSQCSCKKKLRFLLMNVEMQGGRRYFQQDGRNTTNQVRWSWYLRADQPRSNLKIQCENICEYFELSFKS